MKTTDPPNTNKGKPTHLEGTVQRKSEGPPSNEDVFPLPLLHDLLPKPNTKVVPSFVAPPTPTYSNLPEIPDELEKIYRKVYAPKSPTPNSKSRYSQNTMPDFPFFPPTPNHTKKKLPLPTLKQVQKAIPPKASSVFHVLDRRINFDSFPPNVSLYSLLR